MRTEFKRALVTAILATVFVGGCARQPEAFSATTPGDLKQLTEVTDRVLLLARSLEESAEPSSRREAIRQAIAAVAAAESQYQRHGDAISNRTNAETLGCIRAHAMNILDLEIIIARLDEAAQRQDEAKVTGRKTLLQKMAMDASHCAAQSTQLLVMSEKRRDALEHGSILISKIYAIAATNRAASGLSLGPLLESQIRTYETVVAKLGPKHDVPVVTDALPKLRETVAMLETSGSGRVEPALHPQR
jgi:hypothetical protein